MKHPKALLSFILLFSSSLLWASEPAATVEMGNQLTFEPASVTIKAGETVEFVNGSPLVHTVTADPVKAITLGASALQRFLELLQQSGIDAVTEFSGGLIIATPL